MVGVIFIVDRFMHIVHMAGVQQCVGSAVLHVYLTAAVHVRRLSCLYACMSVCMSVCMHVCMCACLYV